MGLSPAFAPLRGPSLAALRCFPRLASGNHQHAVRCFCGLFGRFSPNDMGDRRVDVLHGARRWRGIWRAFVAFFADFSPSLFDLMVQRAAHLRDVRSELGPLQCDPGEQLARAFRSFRSRHGSKDGIRWHQNARQTQGQIASREPIRTRESTRVAHMLAGAFGLGAAPPLRGGESPLKCLKTRHLRFFT